MKTNKYFRLLMMLICIAAISSILPGCSDKTAEKEEVQEEETAEEKSSKKKVKKEKKEEPERPEFLNVECVTKHYQMKDGDFVSADGLSYEFILDDEIKEAYPELAQQIEKINSDEYDDFCSQMESASAGARQRHMDGWEYPYDVDLSATVTRADNKAFSYGVQCFSYLGGAHGYTDYVAKTIDPVNGREIYFADVVEDTRNFADICFDEIIKQNPDLKEYFGSLSSDKENLLKSINERIEKGTLTWSLKYDGIRVYFEDYAMGSYAAGSVVVDIPYEEHKEIFGKEFFTYKNGIPNIDDHVKANSIEDPETLVTGDQIMKIGYDWDNAGEFLLIPEEYQKLKMRVDEICENRKNVYVTRAQETLFSMVQSYEDVSQEVHSRILVGINIDPKTGEDLTLEDIVTDTDSLKKEIKSALKKAGYPDTTQKNIYDELSTQLDRENTASDRKLSWSAGYEGLTFYCNNAVNFEVMDFGKDATVLFLPYTDNKELYKKTVTKHPPVFAYEIPVSAYFDGVFYMDMQYDGNYKDVFIYPRSDEYGYADRMTFGINSLLESIDDVSATDINATVVNDPMGDYYLYVQLGMEESWWLRVFTFSYGKLSEVKPEDGETLHCEFRFPTAIRPGYIMTDPLDFYIRDYNKDSGIRDRFARCCIDSLGLPKEKEEIK